jgi:hypothetical protein
MIRKLSLVAALLAVVASSAVAFVPAASAEEPDAVLRGAGVLGARGSGVVAVKGRMDLEVSADHGILLVKDIAGDAEVHVRGDGGSGEYHGFDVYFGTGSADITGSHVAVIVVSKHINLHVIGKGWAYLKGRGYFEVNNRGPFPWDEFEGRFAPLEPDPEEPAE